MSKHYTIAEADKIGLQRAWFQDKSLPHYDLVPSRRVLALRYGAQERSLRAWHEERRGN